MLVVIMDSNIMKKLTEGLLEKALLFSQIENYKDIDRTFPPHTHPFPSTNKKISPNMKNAVLSCNQTTRC
jgi:hypothetical protein